MTAIVERAHAKLNVCLRVLGRRDDGDHDIQTLILPLELHDVITVTPADAFAVSVDGERADDLSAAGGESILARAAARFVEATGLADLPPVHVRVDKRIPVAAGMGGGSADAAALLRVLGARDSTEPERLAAIGASVGADVPALLAGGPVFAEGRGERVAPVHGTTTHWVVKPFGLTVRAADAYGWWDEAPVTGPDPGALVGAFETGRLDVLADAATNDLEAGVAARHPAVGHAAAVFREAGALTALMTGSGPTVVALAADPAHADRLAAAVRGAIVTSGPPRTMTR
ncbi:MAG TPA: 4-(cytidine 5'-diphospho)-2-C-methyl-D-erythritol kinase [Actinomycetota bacterium]|nr:4-(cytidine 5'-diphospho)-2-C-methyl-D-erythritol kinase [Actinomycetota bacterium]